MLEIRHKELQKQEKALQQLHPVRFSLSLSIYIYIYILSLSPSPSLLLLLCVPLSVRLALLWFSVSVSTRTLHQLEQALEGPALAVLRKDLESQVENFSTEKADVSEQLAGVVLPR